ncbi:MAG: Crp/Fnr family transcriptional regulator [Bacteroidales bacterium]|nr:Crp/Fnr family transcriptional regulator [Bacteroidales bacterium]
MIHILKNSPVFKGINPAEIEEILIKINHQLRSYNSGTIIYHNGDECNNLLTVIEGSVKGEMADFSGKIIKIEDIETPRHIAAAIIFGSNNKYPVNVVANSDVKILFIPKESFLILLQTNQIILSNYLDIISNRTQFLSNKIRFLSFKTIKSKIAHFMLELSKRQNNNFIILPKTQKELAEFFGVTRPSLGRIIGELENDGIIKAKAKNIEILNKESLIRLLQ